MDCKNCKHWTKTGYQKVDLKKGQCDGLLYSEKIDIELHDVDDSVDYIETDEDWFCGCFVERELKSLL